MKTAEFVKKLLAKAGVTHEAEITDEIPDEVATAADNALLTISAAINNHPQVKKVYFAQAYNGLDTEVANLIEEFGFSQNVRDEIEQAGVLDGKPGGASTKRMAALVRKIKEISDKTVPADKEAAKKLNDQITELNGKLAAEIKKQTDLKTEYDNQLRGVKIQTKLSSMLGAYKTVYDELPAEAKEAAINALITKGLSDNDADFTFDEKGALTLQKKDGSNLFGDNHTQVTPQAFIDKTLSKILKVTPANTGNNSSANSGNTTPASTLSGGQHSKDNPALDAALAESLDSFTKGTKQNGVLV